MKYNKSEIMKNAWNLKKNYKKLTFSECLKRSWEKAKIEYQNTLVPTVFTNNMEITVDGYTRTLTRWTKYGYDRVYINGGSRQGDGFVDIKNKRSFLRGNLTYQTKMAEKILVM